MIVNGKKQQLNKRMTVRQFLEQQGYTPERVAVERNGTILPQEAYQKVELSDADLLEIVHFVGGG